MNVVILMAGHSRRFAAAGYRGPKALLEVGDKLMIEHVVDMFDPNADAFHVVVNHDQLREVPDLEGTLKRLARRLQVVAVAPHEDGPVRSALAITGIEPDEEAIVSYCDFIVDWDYARFLREVQGFEGAVVAFRGFQPASLGKTYYAYMRVADGRMLALREKRCFGDDRTQEPASAGIYYFRNWETFRRYGEGRLGRPREDLPEVYVSQLYNDMVADGLEVAVPEVERFVCMGTPEDVAEYQFWWEYLNRPRVPAHGGRRKARRVGLIPMAGRGARFREFGYRVAKPLILVGGQPMVLKALGSLPEADHWIFLPRAQDLERHPIAPTLQGHCRSLDIVPVERETSGQAATCLLAADRLDPTDELIIASCDYEHHFDPEAWQAILDDASVDVAIWTFRAGSLPLKNPQAFAYCRVESDGRTVREVVEKQTISDEPGRDPLVVGTFWFRRAADFAYAASKLIARDIRVNGEHYVGTSLNLLIARGKRIVIFDVEKWISFGDPFELRVMEWWQDHFEAAQGRARSLAAIHAGLPG